MASKMRSADPLIVISSTMGSWLFLSLIRWSLNGAFEVAPALAPQLPVIL
jgi:hypothetical protein